MFIIKVLVFGAFITKAKFENPALKYSKNFIKPCFEGEKDDIDYCSKPGSNCGRKTEKKAKQKAKLQLVRLDGVRTGFEQDADLGEGKNYKLITRAMKPLMFEIPNFLSDEESAHIINLAVEGGLETSIAGFNKSMYEGDLEKELEAVDDNYIPDGQLYVTHFKAWDKNNDDIISKAEIKFFLAKYRLLYLGDDEIEAMFDKLGFYGYENGAIGKAYFHFLNFPKMFAYLDYLKNKHPRHRPRFSKQAWLPQNKASDPVLRKLLGRVTKLTKLPQKIIQGGEALQVVNYKPFGHYHIHYDSTPMSDRLVNAPCCHFNTPKPDGCRLCRFITILYYLNDVEQGGETAFAVADNATYDSTVLTRPNSSDPVDDFNLSLNCHKSNLVVTPRKNSAIMWYNHFIDDDTGLLGRVDDYSLHGGCDVIKGEKWIANNWLTAPTPGNEEMKSVYDVGFD